MSRKSFKAKSRVAEDREFDIDGEVFHLRKKVPGTKVLNLFAEATEGGEESTAGSISAMTDLFRISITKDDVDRFFTYCDDEDNEVTLEVLMEVMEYVVETMAGERPTQPSEPSTGS